MQFKRDLAQNSKKLHLDKYYTSDDVAQHCIDVARKVLKGKIITEVIEPSAGNGVFSKKIKNCIAYDLEPEDDSIIQADFLTLNLEYKKGRLFIGNPPYGSRNTLSVKFFKKCIQSGDYVAFILPISQLNNNQQMYEFDLIYSEDLGKTEYSDRKIHCCFNVYKRPIAGLNKKTVVQIDGVQIIESRLGKNRPEKYDYAICAWGASIGKNIGNNHFAKEFYFVLDADIKNKVIELLEVIDWKLEFAMTSTPNLLQWQVLKYLDKSIILR
jgi:predicted RNA methylase